MLRAVLCLLSLAADPGWEGRIERLSNQLEGMRAIPVVAECRAEAESRLAALEGKITPAIDSDEEMTAVYLELEQVLEWLFANAVEKPAPYGGEFRETTAGWTLSAEDMVLAINRDDLSMSVTAGEAVWEFQPSAADDVRLTDYDLDREFPVGDAVFGETAFSLASARTKTACAFHTSYSAGMTLTLGDFAAAPGLEFHITYNMTGREMTVEIVPREGASTVSMLRYPKPVILEGTAREESVIPVKQGLVLPGDSPTKIFKSRWLHMKWLYMPWWGQIRNGHGVQTIVDTTFDGGCEYAHNPGGPTVIQPWWEQSLGRLGYTRVIHYIFSDSASYVSMAKRYRRYTMDTGLFTSLREKCARTPALADVIGAPVLHLGSFTHVVSNSESFRPEHPESNLYFTTFDETAEKLRAIKAKGIENAYVHLDGWGYRGYDNAHPDIVPPNYQCGGWEGLRRLADTCEELGWVFAVHDQYRDYYHSAALYDLRMAKYDVRGDFEDNNGWNGGPHTILSAWFAPGCVQRNHDALLDHGVKMRGAYLDCFAVSPIEESTEPNHPLSREDCFKLRKRCFDLLRARGYVVSSEEPVDCFMGTLDLCHHAPHVTDRDGFPEPMGKHVPLHNLVYHDAILTPWYFEEWATPTPQPNGFLHCLLNAGLPYLTREDDPKHLERVKVAADLAKRCGFAEMTNHEFLSEDNMVQRTTFSNGVQVTVDFGDDSYAIKKVE